MKLTPLAEFLLAYRPPGASSSSNALVRLGTIQTTVPIFPPNTTVSFSTYPEFGSYVTIEFFWRLSPEIVPGAFHFDIRHSGMMMLGGLAGELGLVDGYNTWLVITATNPIINTVTNVSGMNQFLEAQDFYLLIDNQTDYAEVMRLVQEWGGRKT